MDLQRKIQAFELAGYHKILRVPWTQKKSNKWVFEQIGNNFELLQSLKKRKLTYYSHMTEGDTLDKDIVVGATPGERRTARPRRQWVKDIDDWMGLQINTAAGLAFDRRQWKEAVRHAADPSTKDST